MQSRGVVGRRDHLVHSGFSRSGRATRIRGERPAPYAVGYSAAHHAASGSKRPASVSSSTEAATQVRTFVQMPWAKAAQR